MDVIHTMDPYKAEKWNNKNQLNPYYTNVTGPTPEPVLCKNFYNISLHTYIPTINSIEQNNVFGLSNCVFANLGSF